MGMWQQRSLWCLGTQSECWGVIARVKSLICNAQSAATATAPLAAGKAAPNPLPGAWPFPGLSGMDMNVRETGTLL